MVGSSVIAIPYAFYNSGLLVGILLSFLSYVTSMQTCIYIARTTQTGNDYFDAIKVYYGSIGYHLYLGSLTIMTFAGTAGYFMIISQML